MWSRILVGDVDTVVCVPQVSVDRGMTEETRGTNQSLRNDTATIGLGLDGGGEFQRRLVFFVGRR